MAQSDYTTLGVQLLWAALVVELLELLANWSYASFNMEALSYSGLLGFLIWWGLTAKVAQDRSWARILYVLFTILAVLVLAMMIAIMASASQIPGLHIAAMKALVLLNALQVTLQVTGLILVFTPTTSAGTIVLVVGGVTVIAASTTAFLVQSVLPRFNSNPKSAFALTRVAGQIKQERTFPMMIDEDTEAFDVKGQEGTLVYYYRLVKVNANEFDAAAFLDRMKPAVTERFCSQDDKGLFQQGVVVRASYVDKSNAAIGSLDVNRGDCEAAATNAPAHHAVWKKYEPQPEAKPDAPWKSETSSQTPTATPAAKRHDQSVETPEAKAQALVDDGNSQLQHGNYDAAIKDFQAALALEPSNYAARSGLQEAQHMR